MMQAKEQAMIPEEVGKRAAYALLSQIHAGGTVDGLHQARALEKTRATVKGLLHY